MFVCTNCGERFDEPLIVRQHWTDDEHYELEEVCPYCRNYFEEIEEGEEQ